METCEILKTMGQQIKLARLRRRLAGEILAKKDGISRTTLYSIEKGSPAVTIGNYASVLAIMDRMDKDFLLIAKNDEKGNALRDELILKHGKAPRY